ncbi:MAG: HipA domain-containing protein [Bacteroidia bacterium]|nr:HipA domain-containing protein [Bacteroidia bacterium]MCF8428289.1 HipA domain-containing protein [Bacteroidia bacterium]MCF8446843.1 HipA domain-containing protein [Bacteroidia bacterium]
MMNKLGTKLRIEKSSSCSGPIRNFNKIELLKNCNYLVKNYELDGDAPKQFIKAYFFEEDGIVKKNITSSWRPFIAKTAEKWYPHESIIEYLINRIGVELNLEMNRIKLVRANGQIRFLSEYFLNRNSMLVHGAEICGQHLGDMDMAKEIANHKPTARELFTFEFIKDSIRSVYPNCFEPLIVGLVKLLTFDAIVGNNDRHFYNWGIIDFKKNTTKLPTFAPIYDSARGLFWNEDESSIKNLLGLHRRGHKKVLNYLDGACPRISIESNTKANHFELIDFIRRYNKEYDQIVSEMITLENEEFIIKMVEREFGPFFTKERIELINLVLELRFKKIRGI